VRFVFTDHTLDVERRELRRGSDPIAVEPQVLDLLIYLIENRDHVVSKNDLIASVWGGRIVSDSTLTSRINAARRAIGDSGDEQKLIRNIARKGIRFVESVDTQTNSGGSLPAVPGGEVQEPPRSALPLPDRPAIAVLPFINIRANNAPRPRTDEARRRARMTSCLACRGMGKESAAGIPLGNCKERSPFRIRLTVPPDGDRAVRRHSARAGPQRWGEFRRMTFRIAISSRRRSLSCTRR
jgi:DNA-binding winged helix-turn-helix (wHTH) protein